MDTVIPGMRPGEIPIPASQIPVNANIEHCDPNYAEHEQRSEHPGTPLMVASVKFPNPTRQPREVLAGWKQFCHELIKGASLMSPVCLPLLVLPLSVHLAPPSSPSQRRITGY